MNQRQTGSSRNSSSSLDSLFGAVHLVGLWSRSKQKSWREICETFNQSDADDDKLLVQRAVLHSGSVYRGKKREEEAVVRGSSSVMDGLQAQIVFCCTFIEVSSELIETVCWLSPEKTPSNTQAPSFSPTIPKSTSVGLSCVWRGFWFN